MGKSGEFTLPKLEEPYELYQKLGIIKCAGGEFWGFWGATSIGAFNTEPLTAIILDFLFRDLSDKRKIEESIQDSRLGVEFFQIAYHGGRDGDSLFRLGQEINLYNTSMKKRFAEAADNLMVQLHKNVAEKYVTDLMDSLLSLGEDFTVPAFKPETLQALLGDSDLPIRVRRETIGPLCKTGIPISYWNRFDFKEDAELIPHLVSFYKKNRDELIFSTKLIGYLSADKSLDNSLEYSFRILLEGWHTLWDKEFEEIVNNWDPEIKSELVKFLGFVKKNITNQNLLQFLT